MKRLKKIEAGSLVGEINYEIAGLRDEIAAYSAQKPISYFVEKWNPLKRSFQNLSNIRNYQVLMKKVRDVDSYFANNNLAAVTDALHEIRQFIIRNY